jgi:starch synthase (maltosyl-transferring)
MKNLDYILQQLESRRSNFKGAYYIPKVWNVIKYSGYSETVTRKGQINVNPYDFMSSCIKTLVSAGSVPTGCDYLPAIGLHDTAETNITKSLIYGMLPRMFTAWDHYADGRVCPGTFLKAICLLPRLKALNVDIIYLLPVFEHSYKYKKGELGSPYAIKNIYKLDPCLHDGLLGKSTEMVETEFRAFVEACHLLGIKVMLDFVFRTVSRDNDLLLEHPDWFYWIDYKSNDTFEPPVVEAEQKLILLNNKSFKKLYTCKGIRDYLAKFTYSPSQLDKSKWRQIVSEHRKTGQNILELIEDRYSITTAPGFSNVINDPQPPWTDVTYLKFYHDNHKKARRYVAANQAPYILQDVACLNLYHGDIVNRELWEYILGVIPYYQYNFGIDGARIDMGHALPTALNQEIITRVKSRNVNFILWSEEFSAENSQAAKDDGFHFISGSLWSVYKSIDKSSFCSNLTKMVVKAAIPLTAALETPDTPRLVLHNSDKKRITFMILLNCFLPNTIPFINNGMELMELQPMNLGLDNEEAGRFVLEKQDPMYGKLAFFDNYCLHWLHNDAEWMWQLLKEAFSLRSRFAGIIAPRENFLVELSNAKNKKIIFLFFRDNRTAHNLFLLANKNFDTRTRINFAALLPERYRLDKQSINLIYTAKGASDISREFQKNFFLEPGEVTLGFVQ